MADPGALDIISATPPPPTGPVVLAVGGLKGGLGKTTTAVHLAAIWAFEGRRVLLVDADPQGSAAEWARLALLPCDHAPAPAGGPAALAGAVAAAALAYDVVVIDTPPGDPAVLAAALSGATGALLPVAPTRGDALRVRATLRVARRALDDGATFWMRGVVTRARAGTRSLGELRTALAACGLPACQTEIPLRENLAQAPGRPVAVGGPYSALAAELAAYLPSPAARAATA